MQRSETSTLGDRDAADPEATVAVLLPLPLYTAYDYRIPEDLALAEGDFVEVPLGGRLVLGVVWGRGGGTVAASRLKPIRARIEAPPLPAVVRRFVDWVAAYTVHPPGSVLKMTMSVTQALEPPKAVPTWTLKTEAGADGTSGPGPLTPGRERVLAVLAAGPPLTAAELCRAAKVGPATVKGMVGAGLLTSVARIAPARPVADWRRPGPQLSPSQVEAAAALRQAVAAGFSATFLDGVPGSGKTEVYFEAIGETLRRGRQALVLLPEIALGAQWLARFAARFGAEPGQWHSDLGQAERRRTWRGVLEGSLPVVVGARSALFLPFPDLGLIVVDEEHDGSFKQDEGVTYNARDMAVVRARLGDIPIVLASATPSLETIANVREGRYRTLVLPARFGAAPPPMIDVIDLRQNPPPRGAWLSPLLTQRLAENLAQGQQSLVFLNRRGYAPLTLCRTCGHRFGCPQCTAWLVEHRLIGRLRCHHCGHDQPMPSLCPACGGRETLAACGPGVERVADEVRAVLPDSRLAIATSDTLTGPRAAALLVERINDRAVDIIVGTQIMAKGYHFPLLTLVGVVDGDLGLAGSDLRAAERTFQLLSQVGGRAGRADRPGRVCLQTYQPDHPVMAALAAADRARFLAAEEAARQAAGMPPFGRLAALIVSGPDEAQVEAVARDLARSAPAIPGVRVLGPAPAPLALLRGRHRRRLLLKAPARAALAPVLRAWLGALKHPSSVRIQVDVDPINFL
jgi:primosomal protein N' (replication factor Y)